MSSAIENEETPAEKRASLQEQTHAKMVSSPIGRLVITLAVPSIISLMVTAIYNLTDTFFVGQLGTSASAGVGIVYPLMTIINSVGLLFGKGTGTCIARLLGNCDTRKAEEFGVLGLYAVFAVCILLAAPALALATPLARFLGATDSMMVYSVGYITFILIAMPFKAASVTLSSMLRFQGYFARSMVGLSSGAILNVILDPLFIFGFHWGVKGAAIATMLSEIFSYAVLTIQFHREGSIRLRYKEFHFSRDYLSTIIRGGFPSLVKNSLSSVATILLNVSAGIYGDAAVAALSIVARFIHVCQTVFFGIGESCQSVCSFNYGARHYDRVRACFWFCIRTGLVMMLAISFLSWLGAPDIIALFRRDDAEVIRIGTIALKLQLTMLPLIPVCSTAFVMLQGIGKNTQAMLVGIGRQGMFLVPILLVLPHFFGLTGILAAQPISDFLAFLQAMFLVRPVLAELSRMQTAEGGSQPITLRETLPL